MHVLVAPGHPLPTADGPLDALPGELVHLPVGMCANCRLGEPCGWCEDAFTGVASHRATVVAEVADRELTPALVVQTVADSLLDANLFWGSTNARARAEDLAHALTNGLLRIASDLPAGTVVERTRTRIAIHARR